MPSTPLHIISDHHFYGHLPTIAPKEKYPETITEPLTWLPHPVNPSGVTQTPAHRREDGAGEWRADSHRLQPAGFSAC